MNPSAATMHAPPPAFVDLDTAARIAGVTRRTVQNKLASREIPRKAVKMDGRRKLVAVDALQSAFGSLHSVPAASSPQEEAGGDVHGNFHEALDLRAKLAAQDSIITSLQATLDHERQDRAHERENWRQTLERTQANLLAAQDTPTARAIAGAPAMAAEIPTADTTPTAPQAEVGKPKARRERKGKPARRWWRSLFARGR